VRTAVDVCHVEMVPGEIQQEMKNLYCALCELLRHFWACFPTTTKALEDKVCSHTERIVKFDF